jgi:hypothetical protein
MQDLPGFETGLTNIIGEISHVTSEAQNIGEDADDVEKLLACHSEPLTSKKVAGVGLLWGSQGKVGTSVFSHESSEYQCQCRGTDFAQLVRDFVGGD